MPATHIRFTTHGSGPTRVLVLHDWYCDHTSWDASLPYATTNRFTYVLADLRGYGLSREMTGSYTLEEAASDVVSLANHLGWTSFSLLGHSMSSVVVQRVVQIIPARIARIVVVTPVPPTGMRLGPEVVNALRSLALATDEERFAVVSARWGTRLAETWIRYKLTRWRETASPVAVASYVTLWACTDISDRANGIDTPMLIIAGAQDALPFQMAALKASMLPYYPSATLLQFGESGHYPMQEQPPLLMTTVERFLGQAGGTA